MSDSISCATHSTPVVPPPLNSSITSGFDAAEGDPLGGLRVTPPLFRYATVLLAALDQIYHSPAAISQQFNSTAALADLYDARGLIPYVHGTSWQTQFGHLFGYGATYYSYLFDRAIASHVWRRLFSHNPLNRLMGEKYKQEVLRYGGGKDPWKRVTSLLNSPELGEGEAAAMAEVGRWKVEDEVSSLGRHR